MTRLPDLGVYRIELTGFCYRMLGSAFDAEDAVQETMLRAWQRRKQFDSTRGSARTWLYTIARHVCVDMLRSSHRRTRPTMMGGPAAFGSPLGDPLEPERWVTPVPEDWVIDAALDPASIVEQRASIQLAFVAALQALPPRQRAALILKDVLALESAEVAKALETSVPAVNSALQRARLALARLDLTPTDVAHPSDPAQAALAERFARAFEANDIGDLVALMRDDAAMTMPPFRWWLRGRDTIGAAMEATDACRGSRLVSVAASGTLAFAQYRRAPSGPGWQPWALIALELRRGLIQELCIFLDQQKLLAVMRPHSNLAEAVIA